MKKTLIALVAATALITGTMATPQPAKADPISALWLIPAVVGGLWLGGALGSGRAYAGAYAGPYAYSNAGPYAYSGGGQYGYSNVGWGPGASWASASGGWSNCWMERRRVGGVSRTARVCIQ